MTEMCSLDSGPPTAPRGLLSDARGEVRSQAMAGALRAGLPPIRTQSGPGPRANFDGTSHDSDGRTIREARHAFT
jgi:hypothetical protein